MPRLVKNYIFDYDCPMPRLIKKYLCDFKCGTRAMKNIPIATRHESNCRLNPANRTCDTCKFYKLVEDGCDHPERPGCPSEYWVYHECKHPDFDGFAHLPEESCDQKSDLPLKAKFCHKWNGGEYPIELEVPAGENPYSSKFVPTDSPDPTDELPF